ncbi:MAG TPA: DUF3048 domain-containing protein [Propionibacteriaceae bacterium]|nr:DUF3048 domain-containing protein [Propionibacteriaceae bacterium]
MTHITRRTLIAGSLGVAGLAATGCSSSGSSSQSASSPSSAVTPSPTPSSASPSPSPTAKKDTRPRAPLTGRLIADPSKLDHPAVAVKVPNLRQEYPQLGIEAADIVFVEKIGPSMTRLVPVFHSTFPPGVNPVRSVRPVDIALLSPMRPVFANTGDIPWVINYLHHYPQYIEDKPYMDMRGTDAYGIDGSRVYQIAGTTYYDRAVVAHPAELARLATRLRKPPPEPYLPFALTDAEVSTNRGRAASSVAVTYDPGCTMSYSYDKSSHTYLRSEPWGPHVTATGVRIRTDNVLVIRANWRMGKIYSGRGGDDPVTDIVNTSGSFFYLHGGKYVTGTWKKGPVESLFSFTTPDGKPLKVAPGKTWIELPPKDAGVRVTA